MRKVLVGTPCYDGRADVYYVDSLIRTILVGRDRGVLVHAIYTSYDSLIQRARNSLFRLAMVGDWDDLFFIDSDTEWKAEDFFSVLERPEPVVGAALVKKAAKEGYTVRVISKTPARSEDGRLIEVDGVGTGFLRLTRFAFEKLWNISERYVSEEEDSRMVCDIRVVNGQLVSEDYVIAAKWRSLGYKTWLDPSITINHVGHKKYEGDFQKFLNKNGYT